MHGRRPGEQDQIRAGHVDITYRVNLPGIGAKIPPLQRSGAGAHRHAAVAAIPAHDIELHQRRVAMHIQGLDNTAVVARRHPDAPGKAVAVEAGGIAVDGDQRHPAGIADRAAHHNLRPIGAQAPGLDKMNLQPGRRGIDDLLLAHGNLIVFGQGLGPKQSRVYGPDHRNGGNAGHFLGDFLRRPDGRRDRLRCRGGFEFLRRKGAAR